MIRALPRPDRREATGAVVGVDGEEPEEGAAPVLMPVRTMMLTMMRSVVVLVVVALVVTTTSLSTSLLAHLFL